MKRDKALALATMVRAAAARIRRARIFAAVPGGGWR
jgi:hypothetical protein